MHMEPIIFFINSQVYGGVYTNSTFKVETRLGNIQPRLCTMVVKCSVYYQLLDLQFSVALPIHFVGHFTLFMCVCCYCRGFLWPGTHQPLAFPIFPTFIYVHMYTRTCIYRMTSQRETDVCVFVLLHFMVKCAIKEGGLPYLRSASVPCPSVWSKYKPDKIPHRPQACEHGLQMFVLKCFCPSWTQFHVENKHLVWIFINAR